MREKVVQAVLQFRQAFVVAAFACNADVVDYHGADAFFSRLGLHKIASEFRGNHFGHMLVFADRRDLFFGEAGQFDTIVERQHDGAPFSATPAFH